MPNWATGTLKIRGKKEDILKFCKEKMPRFGAINFAIKANCDLKEDTKSER